jgi:energy-coupling factor transporter transmembrane protein EcfT
METLINLYINLIKIVKIVQERIKRYYNAKRSRGLDLKEGDKV